VAIFFKECKNIKHRYKNLTLNLNKSVPFGNKKNILEYLLKIDLIFLNFVIELRVR